ncbi:MAG: PDZ domain-containing protein [Fimbriimonadaceae bacterium]|nr:PDZ domain-containing protein [Fimbriimonadaceae bacterium]
MLLGFAALVLAARQPASVEVPFRVAEDAILLDATVNGKKVSLMFDTGYSGTVVLSDTINLGRPSGTQKLRDFVGEFEARTVDIRSLKIGEMTIEPEDMVAVQQPTAHLSSIYNAHADGLLGLAPFRHHVTEINFERSRVVFHPSSLDVTKRTPDNRRTFLARILPIGRNTVEMHVEAPGGKMVLALDTGNGHFATTHRDVLERVGLWESGRTPTYLKQSWVASGPVDSWYKRMGPMTVYGVPVPSSVWSIIDLPSSSAEGDGTVGFGFLRNFNIVLDQERRRVWLDNFTGQVGNELPGEPGLTIQKVATTGRFHVWRTSKGGPADAAGVRAGDELLGVDDKDLVNLTTRAVERLLEGQPGSTVRLAVSRAGQLLRFSVERRALENP